MVLTSLSSTNLHHFQKDGMQEEKLNFIPGKSSSRPLQPTPCLQRSRGSSPNTTKESCQPRLFAYQQGRAVDFSTGFSKPSFRSTPYCGNGETSPKSSSLKLFGVNSIIITALHAMVKPQLSYVLGYVTISKERKRRTTS